MLKTYSIATGNEESSKAAAIILDNGGNAYDAILAALFMSFVCEPLLSSPGGGGYLLAHPANAEAKIFDFFAQTPLSKDRYQKDFYPIIGDFGATKQEFHIGLAAAAIPGIPAGIFAIHHHYGSMPLPEIASLAVARAKKGMVVDELQAEIIQILNPILAASCHAKALFSNKEHELLKKGEMKNNLNLADFLQNLAENPCDWFYYDMPADIIVNDMKHNGGLLQIEDFNRYQVEMRQPLIAKIKNWKIMTNAAPTTGGFLITQQLKHAAQSQSTNHYKKIIAAMQYAQKLKHSSAFQSSKGTTHMSVIDAQNNVATMTVSNGEGCGYVMPHGGFMLNNFLGEEDINTQGFFNFKENTRMASMMSPTIIENKHSRIALGTGGSNRIKTALFQVIWHIIGENKTLDAAINQPRLHLENAVLEVEKGIDAKVIQALDFTFKKINFWQSRSLFFGGINAAQHGTTSLAIADSRRNGVGLVKSASSSVSV